MPSVRLRRLRQNSAIRDLVSETQLLAGDLIMPYFVIEGKGKREKIKAMPGIARLSVDNLLKDIKEAKTLGIKAVLLFGICNKKDEEGSEAYNNDGIIQKAVRAIKKNVKDIGIITDVCLCGYTSHGHCGIVRRGHRDFIDTDVTLKALAKIAVSHAEAGADFVAPSAMMDCQIRTIRNALDRGGFKETGILAYSAKYASNFYGPFREALDSRPAFGDRKTYQMDYRNSDEALREVGLDIEEGADIVMVKPALAYLDVIYRVKERFNVPVAAYNVSGEYALMSQEPRAKSHEMRKDLILEVLTGIKRAGADLIITYHAKEAAKWLRQ